MNAIKKGSIHKKRYIRKCRQINKTINSSKHKNKIVYVNMNVIKFKDIRKKTLINFLSFLLSVRLTSSGI